MHLNWAIIVPAIISGLAVIISLLNLWMTRATFKRDGWIVRAHVEIVRPLGDDIVLSLRLNNAGALEAKIVRFHFAFDYASIKFRGQELAKPILSGPDLKYTLPSGDEAVWTVSLANMKESFQEGANSPHLRITFNPFKLFFVRFWPPLAVGIDIQLGSGDTFSSRLGMISSIRVAFFFSHKKVQGEPPSA